MNRLAFPLIAMLGALLGALPLGCGPVGPGPAGPSLGKPDFTLTAKEFREEWDKDKQAVNAKYKDKVLEVTGTVIGLHVASDGKSTLVLEGEPKSVKNVFCYPTDPKPWNKVTPGQTAKVKGKLPPFPNDAALIDCTIGEVTGDPSPTVSAADLAREFAADDNAARQKYGSKYLIVTGEVESVQVDRAKGSVVALKTGAATRVSCSFTEAPKALEGLKPGQQVKLLARISLGSKDQVQCFDSILMDDAK
jgi:hypothetical protein